MRIALAAACLTLLSGTLAYPEDETPGFPDAPEAVLLSPVPSPRLMARSQILDQTGFPAPSPGERPAPFEDLSPPGPPPIPVAPNADGLVDLTGIGAGAPAPDDGLPNPFRVRYHPPVPAREFPLEVASVLLGDPGSEASAIVNGDVVSPGDSVDGLRLEAISAAGLEFEDRGRKLLLPLPDRPLTLRIAP